MNNYTQGPWEVREATTAEVLPHFTARESSFIMLLKWASNPLMLKPTSASSPPRRTCCRR